jgi:hypothetical protein
LVYQLDLRKCICQLVGQRKKYKVYQPFKDKNTLKSTIYQTIKDSENGLPCVVKPKIAKPRVADNKKVQNVLQSIRNRVRTLSRLVASKATVPKYTPNFFVTKK